MPAERDVEPDILQALEESQDALRAVQRTQGPLTQENARLRTRLEQLQAERDRLRLTLEGLRRERDPNAPRLPESLETPFEVRGQALTRRRVRWFLPVPLFALLMLIWEWNQGPIYRAFLSGVLLLVVVVQGVMLAWRGEPLWRFEASSFEGGGREGTRGLVYYSDVVDVQVHVSPSQRRRGVGTVVVTRRLPWQATTGETCLLLKDVPEPERLAAWLRAKGSATV